MLFRSVTFDYMRALKNVTKVVLLEDHKKCEMPVDVLVNPSDNAELVEYQKIYQACNAPLPKLLLGSSYLPLRKAFWTFGAKTRKEVTNVLIIAGKLNSIDSLGKIIQNIILPNYSITPNYQRIMFHIAVDTSCHNICRIKEKTKDRKSVV